MTEDLSPIFQLIEAAAAEGRSALLEHEVYDVLARLGCAVPQVELVPPRGSLDPDRLTALGGATGKVVLKVVSPHIAHKTDVGGVAVVPAEPTAVAEGVALMLSAVPRRFAEHLEARPGHAPAPYQGLSGEALLQAITADIKGVLVAECLALTQAGPGSEVLIGLRHNREFGPVLTMGLGGVDTELFGGACKSGLAVVSASPVLLDEEALLAVFRPTLAYQRLAGQTRGGQVLVTDDTLRETLSAFRRAAAELTNEEGEPSRAFTVTELEINPFGVADGRLVALDGLLKFRPRQALPAPRPIASLGPMLAPKSAAVIGVSSKGMNMGRIILRNMLAAGMDKAHTYVIRPGIDAIDDVRCVPDVASLPERVDLFVVVVSADQVPALMEELSAHDKATGVILIPGGMGEKEGGQSIEDRIKAAIADARQAGKPLVASGGNSLGIVSRPGRYNTIFVPQTKLPLREDGRGNLAFISQSGAYMITRLSKLGWLSPRYAISTGNQVDLTASDFLKHLAGDPEVRTFAVYIEGFQDGGGLEFARTVKLITASGRDVIFYKAGRTTEGKTASSGHTASLAGDYDVCAAVLREAGAHVASTFTDFLNLTKISSLMGDKRWGGRNLAALSNAGFETVGMADSLRGEGWHLQLAGLAPRTQEALAAALKEARLDTLVDVRNPLDLTPMASDKAHEDAVVAFLDDPAVDLVLCATVPLTPAMATLADGVAEEQSIRSPGSLNSRLAQRVAALQKPVVVSLDSGALYDPMAEAMERAGLPTFRSADNAVRAMGLYLEGRLRRA